VAVKTAMVSSDGASVTLNLAKPYKGVVKVTLLAGLKAADGTPSSGNASVIVH
jgi:hypothetical protein